MERNTIIGIIFGLVICFGVLALLPGATCRDGWKSNSIGRSGACSHHGGVGGNVWSIPALILGILGGVFVTSVLDRKKRSMESKEKKLAEPDKHDTPYGSIKEYERHLSAIGVSKDQIVEEMRKYTSTKNT